MKMFERFEFDQPVSVSDGQGGREEGWQVMHKCSANLRVLRGGETVQAGRLAGKQAVVVTIHKCRGSAPINTSWRARDARSGEVYNIRSPKVLSDDRQYYEITAESGVAV